MLPRSACTAFKQCVTNELCFHSIEPVEAPPVILDHSLRENLKGEARKDAPRLDFDRHEFHGTKVTSDTGLLAYREPDVHSA